jgi:hypothetical protein
MALMVWAIDVPQEHGQNDANLKERANHENMLMYGLKAEIRLYEVGIPSNRASLRRGETKS